MTDTKNTPIENINPINNELPSKNSTDPQNDFSNIPENQTFEINQQAYQNENAPVVYVYKYIILQPPVTVNDIFPFIAVFAIYCICVHSAFSIIRRLHKPTYNFLIFLLVGIFPPLTMMILKDYTFLSLWGALIIFMLYCLRIGFSSFRLSKDGPRHIYSLFKSIFTFTSAGIVFGQACVFFSTFFYVQSIRFSLRILIYFLYFAVFCREVMVNLSKIMAKTTGYYNKEGIPGRQDDKENCMICVSKLTGQDSIISLSCGHSFHNECLKGWTVIGNNSACIYCKKGIDLTQINSDLWMKAEVAVKPLMNALRSCISFFVVIYLYMLVRLK